MIYLDNAATSFPRPPQVVRAAAGTLEKLGVNPGRSGHRLSVCASRIVHACREEAALLTGVSSAERVIFTHNCTEALNLAIGGMLHRGDEVLCSHGEHNAVMRLLARYASAGEITVRVMPPDRQGLLQPHVVQQHIGPHTALVIVCHASNVTGVMQPVAKIGAVCRENGVPLLVDAAQTAGKVDVSLPALHADMIAMPGHKGLLGPHGSGLLALAEGVDPEPLLYGGTGSLSERMTQPDLLPDRYESGTLDLPAIAGLLAGMRFVRAHREEIRDYEQHLNDRLRRRLSDISGVTVLGSAEAPNAGITSILSEAMDSSPIADGLDAAGVAVRGGLHCCPAIHAWLGTLGTGAVRFSPGIYNTEREIDDAAFILQRILQA